MLVAPTIDEFLEGPTDACAVGERWALWRRDPVLAGSFHWGVLDTAHVHQLRDVIAQLRARRTSARTILVCDCRNVERADPDAILELAMLAREWSGPWSSAIERHLVVVPSDITGLLIAGALSSPSPRHPINFLDGGQPVIDDPLARAAHEAATAAVAAARGRPNISTRVREVLANDLSTPSIDACADRLGVSARTLQRELRRAGSSFSDELRRARAITARSLLAHTDLKLEVIAARVGLVSTTRMTEILQQEFQTSALRLRAARWGT